MRSDQYVRIGGPLTPWVKRLIVINTVVYVTELITLKWLHVPFILDQFALTPAKWAEGLKFWQVFTYSYLHSPDDPSHLILNMLGLWFFAGLLEERWGSINFFKFYIMSGIISGIMVVFVSLADRSQWWVPTVGASGAVYGLIVAFGMIYPNFTVWFYGLFPLKVKHLVWLLLGTTALLALARSSVVSYSGHFGGMLAGYLLVTGYWRPYKLYLLAKLAYVKWTSYRNRKKFGIIWGGKDEDKFWH